VRPRLPVADGHEAVGGQRGQDLGDALVALGVQLTKRDAPAHDRLAFTLAGQPQQNPARDRAAFGVESRVRTLGQPGDGAVYAANLLVRAQTQAPAVAVLPQLQQCSGKQRQRARLILDVGDQPVDEGRLDLQRCAARRQLDGTAQLVAAQRAHEDVVGAEQPGQLGIGGAAAVEVGADCDEHQRAQVRIACRAEQGVHEGRALGLVVAGGEELLELVDGDHQPDARGRLR
jgi:hypothetical protein